MRKVLITGANGFIGSFLAERLCNKGFEVFCLVRKTSDLRWIKDLPVKLDMGELTDFKSLIKPLEGVDCVFHVGAAKSAFTQEQYDRINHIGTLSLLEACKKGGSVKKFVYVSSLAVVGPNPTPIPWEESAACNPMSFYGSSKLKGEEEVKKFKESFSITIIRPPTVYGPRDTDLLPFFKAVKFGIKPHLGFDARFASMVYIEDLVEAIFLVSQSAKASGETYFVCDQDYYSQSEIINQIAHILHVKGINVIIPDFALYTAAGINEMISRFNKKPHVLNLQRAQELAQKYWLCSPAKIKNEIGFIAKTKLEEGIRKTIEWYRENRYI